MPSIYSLTQDIQHLVTTKGGWFSDELAQQFTGELSKKLQTHFGGERDKPTLRLSQMGPKCPRALWYSIHHPELAEALPAWAEIKFAYGHIIEALAITLAKASGHHVVGEQDALELDGIRGHRDCVIDGCTVDVKSASSIGFQKFKLPDYSLVDSFGYLDQLDGYVVASASDPLVTVKDKGYILAIDKTLGHMHVYEHRVRPYQIRQRIGEYKEIVGLSAAPTCTCRTIPDGSSGNMRLDMVASYSAYKHCCFPNLRTFIYDKGPVYLTKVVRLPNVKEIFHGHTLH